MVIWSLLVHMESYISGKGIFKLTLFATAQCKKPHEDWWSASEVMNEMGVNAHHNIIDILMLHQTGTSDTISPISHSNLLRFSSSNICSVHSANEIINVSFICHFVYSQILNIEKRMHLCIWETFAIIFTTGMFPQFQGIYMNRIMTILAL